MSTEKPYYFDLTSYFFPEGTDIFYGYILKRCYIEIIKKIYNLIDETCVDTEVCVDDLEENMNRNNNIIINICSFSINQQQTDADSGTWKQTECLNPEDYIFLILKSSTVKYSFQEYLNKRKQVAVFLKEYSEYDNVCFL